MTAVAIAEDVLGAIVAHARAEAPNECCGLLIGTGTRVEKSVRARNTLASPSRFLIDPADHFRAIKDARAEGRAILGAYHSHPRTAAEPSARDVAEAHDPEMLYLIVSLKEPDRPELRCYRIRDGRVSELAILTSRRGLRCPARRT